MFSQLVAFVWGSRGEEAPTETETAECRVDEIPDRLRLIEDDDWLIVQRDLNSDGDSDHSSESADDAENALEDDLDSLGGRLSVPALMSRSNSSSSSSNAMEGSWHVEPTPIFTSTNRSAIRTSSIENLLIEHPSMSVYHHHQHPHLCSDEKLDHEIMQRQGILADESAMVESFASEQDIVIVALPAPTEPVENRLRYREPQNRHRVDAIRLQDHQRAKYRQAQKVQIQKACKNLKREYLERNNKAREVNCRNHRQRRGERSQGARRSHANNNRKC